MKLLCFTACDSVIVFSLSKKIGGIVSWGWISSLLHTFSSICKPCLIQSFTEAVWHVLLLLYVLIFNVFFFLKNLMFEEYTHVVPAGAWASCTNKASWVPYTYQVYLVTLDTSVNK